MDSALSISVAMATYNGQPFLERQLDSLAAQTYLPAEIVITDDGSTDDTLKIVEAFAKAAPCRVCIHQNKTRLGYRANFMRAAGLCSSDLVAFCDQDDDWYPHKIAASVRPFSDSDVLLTYHDADVISEGVPIGTLASRALREPVLGPLLSPPWFPYALGFTEVFRRSLLPLSYLRTKTLDQHAVEVGEPPAHDQWVFFLASVLGKIAYVDERLVAYVQHGHNAYGWGGEPSFAGRLKSRFKDRSKEYQHLSKAADARALVLDIAKNDLDGIWAERAAAGAAYYRIVSSVLKRRLALYASPTFGERLSAFRAIVGMNGYSSTFGNRRGSFVADMCLGVLSMDTVMRSISK